MGSFLLLLLAQTIDGRDRPVRLHKQVGIAAFVLVPALVVVGLSWRRPSITRCGARRIPDRRRCATALAPVLPRLENILLLQISAGLLFATFIGIALGARKRNAGMHKRMMILATAVPLEAAIAGWCGCRPACRRARGRCTCIYRAGYADVGVGRGPQPPGARGLLAVAVDLPAGGADGRFMWDTPWWHATARAIMGV